MCRKYLGNGELKIEKVEGGSDLIIRTADKTKQIRFDLTNPHGLKPHVNIEAFKPKFLNSRRMEPDPTVVPNGNIHVYPKGGI